MSQTTFDFPSRANLPGINVSVEKVFWGHMRWIQGGSKIWDGVVSRKITDVNIIYWSLDQKRDIHGIVLESINSESRSFFCQWGVVHGINWGGEIENAIP